MAARGARAAAGDAGGWGFSMRRLTSAVVRGRQKSRSTDGPTPAAWRTRLLGVDRREQLLNGAR
jgi:hypothetical protein